MSQISVKSNNCDRTEYLPRKSKCTWSSFKAEMDEARKSIEESREIVKQQALSIESLHQSSKKLRKYIRMMEKRGTVTKLELQMEIL